MKKMMLMLVLASAVLLGGCGGVWMDAKHTLTLDRAVVVSDGMVKTLAATPNGKQKALLAEGMVKADNEYLHALQDSLKGVADDPE